MIYIVIISLILAYLINKYLYKICEDIDIKDYKNFFTYIIVVPTYLLIYCKYGLTVESIKYFSLIPFITIISIIDYYTTYIYDITIVSGIIIQGVVFIICLNADFDNISHIYGLLTVTILSYMLAKLTKALGEGDIYIYGLCGITLGHGYGIYLICLSYLIAFVYCLLLLLMKKQNIKGKIAFAPFISLAAITIMFTEYDILKIYFDILYLKL